MVNIRNEDTRVTPRSLSVRDARHSTTAHREKQFPHSPHCLCVFVAIPGLPIVLVELGLGLGKRLLDRHLWYVRPHRVKSDANLPTLN